VISVRPRFRHGAALLRATSGLALALALTALGPPRAEAMPIAPAVNPSALRGLGATQQVIEISTNEMGTTYATARTYKRGEAGWQHVRGGMPARIGYNGLSLPARRREGDGTTPIGDYGFVYDFGSRPDPGVTGFQWRRLAPGSCWAGTRTDYNRWVVRRPCAPADEDLWINQGLAYRYAAVIDFNYYHPIFGRGSGIFLHVGTGGPTAGCVSLPQHDLLSVLRWMRPGARILIGPSSWLRSLKR